MGEAVPSVSSAIRGLFTLAVLKTEGTVILRNVSFTSTNDKCMRNTFAQSVNGKESNCK